MAGSIQRSDNDGDDEALLGAAAITPRKRLTTCGAPRNPANVFTIACAFLLIFTATQTTQILSSKVLGNLGSMSVSISYTTFAFAGFFAPTVVRKIGPRTGMIVGATCYVIYVASLIPLWPPAVLACSVVIGAGASVLWVSQGMMMTASTTEQNKTKYNSMFWGMFNLSVIPGPLIGHFLLSGGSSDSNATSTAPPRRADDTFGPQAQPSSGLLAGLGGSGPSAEDEMYLFIGLTVFAAAGWLVLLLVRAPAPVDAASAASAAAVDTRSVPEQIMATIKCVGKPRMLCLAPIFTFTGVAMTMWSSWFPRQMHATAVGLILPFFGLTEFVGGFTIGPFVDAFGRSLGLAVGSVATVAALGCTWLGNKAVIKYCTAHNKEVPCQEFDDYTYFYIAAVCYGVMDCCFQSVTAAICTKSFNSTGNGADAWAVFRIFQCFGAAACFLLTTGLSVDGGTTANESQLTIEILLTASFCLLAVFGHELFGRYTTMSHVDAAKVAAPADGLSNHAVVAKGRVHTAGCIGYPHGKNAMSFDASLSVEEQAVAALQHLSAVLEAAGCTFKDCLKVTVFLTDMRDAAAVNKVYAAELLASCTKPPARSMVAVVGLPMGAKVMLEAVAALP